MDSEDPSISEVEKTIFEDELENLEEYINLFDSEPFISDEGYRVKPDLQCFDCTTLTSKSLGCSNTHQNKKHGFLEKGGLEDYLKKSFDIFKEDSLNEITLFKFNYFKDDLLFFNLKHGFCVLKQNLEIIFNECSYSPKNMEPHHFLSERQDVVKFLNAVRCGIQRYYDFLSQNDVVCHDVSKTLNDEIFSLLQFIQWQCVDLLLTKHGDAAFHCILDIYWFLLLILDSCYINNLDQVLDSRLWDNCPDGVTYLTRRVVTELINMSLRVFIKSNFSSSLSPFVCPCVQELFLLLQRLLSHRNCSGFYQPFWTFINDSLESECQSLDKLISKSCFQIWLICSWNQIANDTNSKNKLNQEENNYKFVVESLKSYMNGNVKDNEMKFLIVCFLQLLDAWGPNSEVILILWEHFSKEMTKSSVSDSSVMTSLLNLSSHDIYEKLITNLKSDSRISDHGGTFMMFCRLLGASLNSCPEGQLWKRFKGRLLSKIHPKMMQDMSSSNLAQWIYFFLTLSLTKVGHDLISRLIDAVVGINLDKGDAQKTLIIWKYMFIMLINMVEQDQKCQDLLQKFRTLFVPVFADVHDTGFRKVLSKMMIFYTTEVAAFLEASNFTHGEHHLIGPHVFDGISTLNREAVQSFLQAINGTVCRVRYLINRSHISTSEEAYEFDQMVKTLWIDVFPVVKKLSESDGSMPAELPGLAASYTVLAFQSQKYLPQSLSSLMTHFILSTSVPVSFVNKYMLEFFNHVVVRVDSEDIGFIALKGWIRCCMACNTTESLSKLIISKNCIKCLDLGTLPPVMTIHQFFRTLRKKFNTIESFEKKISFRSKMEKLLSPIETYASYYLKNPSVHVLGVKMSYEVVGSLIYSCSPIIYVKGKSLSVFNRLINKMVVFPTIYDQSKALPLEISKGVRKILPQIIYGLTELMPNADPVIQRFYKDTITQYIGRFMTSTHPFLIALDPTNVNCECYNTLSSFVYGVLGSTYINNVNADKKISETVSKLMLESLRRYQHNSLFMKCLTSVLFPFLGEAYMKNRGEYLHLTNTVMTSWDIHRDNSDVISSAKSSMESLIDSYLPDKPKTTFDFLSILCQCCPTVASKLNVCLVNAIEKLREKRGTDQVMMKHYSTFNESLSKL